MTAADPRVELRTAATPTPSIGDVLVKNGKRYEYRGERKMSAAPGFLICELDGTFLEGTAPHWAPDWALASFELVSTVRQERPAPARRSVVVAHLPGDEAA